ncbi:hypothetical protein [Sorangium sp. So ce1078]|uniref:hypothetical protein n=1 Tax=Sorangium sp. So ce1078 TaxID=3133329 RepID=UPI003F5F259A
MGLRSHAVSSSLDGSFFCDACGRLEQDPEREIRYTSFDLPQEVTMAAGVTRFAYDAAGARVRKAGTTVTLGGLPAIKVGGRMIVDGNYRYIAARVFGHEPAIQPWAGGRPGSVISWDEIRIDPKAWP